MALWSRPPAHAVNHIDTRHTRNGHSREHTKHTPSIARTEHNYATALIMQYTGCVVDLTRHFTAPSTTVILHPSDGAGSPRPPYMRYHNRQGTSEYMSRSPRNHHSSWTVSAAVATWHLAFACVHPPMFGTAAARQCSLGHTQTECNYTQIGSTLRHL